MELWKMLGIVILIALVARSYMPDQYGDAKDYIQNLWEEKGIKLGASEMNFDEVLGDGTVISPDSGTNFGQPYEYFPCIMNETCQYRFSVNSLCDKQTGDCYMP